MGVDNAVMMPCQISFLILIGLSKAFQMRYHLFLNNDWMVATQPAKLGLNKKSFPKQKSIQNFTIDAQGFRKTKIENPPTWEIELTS